LRDLGRAQVAGAGEEAVDVDEADARADALVAHVPVLGDEKLPQPFLRLAERGEVRVPSLAGEGVVAPAVPVETGLAEPGTGRADRSVPARFSVTLVEDVEVVGTESGDAPGVRLEVVQQHDGLQAERLGERGAVDGPRDVRHADAAVANRAGDTEAGRSGLGRMGGEEVAD